MTRAALLVLLAACGDQIAGDNVLEPTSGTRLKLEWYLYEDGTRQVEPDTFYDTVLHARCEPRPYADGTTRCLPFVDEALYIDETCENVVGRGTTLDRTEPTHFIGYDRIDGELLPARVYAALAPREPIREYYEVRDGACEGPFATASDLTYYTLGGAFDLVELRDERVDGERISVRMRHTDDGVRLPVGVDDRARDAACLPEIDRDGSVVCVPTSLAPSMHFRDVACAAPVLALAEGAPLPDAVTIASPAGPTRYHALGAGYAGPVYELRGDRCERADLGEVRVFELGAPLDLPRLEREVDDAPNRRLQRITLRDAALAVADDRLYDSAIRADCRREVIAHTVRCLPAVTTPAQLHFYAGCTLERSVAELPAGHDVKFAMALTEAGTELYAIGAALSEPVFGYEIGECRPYTPRSGETLHALGPALRPDAFARGVRYGER